MLAPSTAQCHLPIARFTFNPANGELRHQCSDYRVCSYDGYLVIDEKCTAPTQEKHLYRTFCKFIKFWMFPRYVTI